MAPWRYGLAVPALRRAADHLLRAGAPVALLSALVLLPAAVVWSLMGAMAALAPRGTPALHGAGRPRPGTLTP